MTKIARPDLLLSPRRRHLLALMGTAALGAACGPRSGPTGVGVAFGGQSMGSTYSVRIGGSLTDAGRVEAARRAVAEALDGVVRRMSTYESTSDIGRFNRHAAATPLPMAADTLAVLARGQQVAGMTNGAFDMTVAPLVAAWGFGAGAATRGARPPVQALSQPVGWQHLELDAPAGHARKAVPNLRLDLSGIAKGHAVDRAALALQALGIADYMVEAGGEVRTKGRNAEGRAWQIAVERPDAWPQQVHRVVPLSGQAMATSGDYRNWYPLDGQRIHHEIDPASRGPAQHALASVSVVHDECMFADAMATALFVLGPERGLALAREHGIAALFIVRTAGGLRDRASPAFAALG